jgi:hypothetical protein
VKDKLPATGVSVAVAQTMPAASTKPPSNAIAVRTLVVAFFIFFVPSFVRLDETDLPYYLGTAWFCSIGITLAFPALPTLPFPL